MTRFEIVVSLLTIVYGLMFADLFASLHRLLRAGRAVKWHWMAPLSAWYLFLIVVKNWWSMAVPIADPGKYTFAVFLVYGHLMILFYLLISVVLPDGVDQEGVDLRAYYFKNHRYFWGLMSAVGLVSLLLSVVPRVVQGAPVNGISLAVACAQLFLTMVMAISRKPRLHAFLLVVFTLGILLEIAAKI